MVSLGDESRRQGGYFFDAEASLSAAESDELVPENSTLSADLDPPFRKIPTTCVIVLQLLLVLGVEVCVFVLPVLCPGKSCGVSAYSLLIYIHAALWFLFMLIDRFLRYHHFISRRNGYLEFYRRTRSIRRIPLMVFSGGNVMLVIVMILLQDYCPDLHSCSGIPLSRENYLQILVSIEIAVLLPVLCIYLGRTIHFNKTQASPDVHQDELLGSFLLSQAQTTEIGFRDEDYLDEVLEKQADMIRYLKQHNSNLGKKILKLTTELNKRRG